MNASSLLYVPSLLYMPHSACHIAHTYCTYTASRVRYLIDFILYLDLFVLLRTCTTGTPLTFLLEGMDSSTHTHMHTHTRSLLLTLTLTPSPSPWGGPMGPKEGRGRPPLIALIYPFLPQPLLF